MVRWITECTIARALARALRASHQHDAGQEGADACGDVHDDPPGKVEDAHLAKETPAPNLVADGAVDQERPESGEEEEAGPLHALDKGADHQTRRDDGEGPLEHEPQRLIGGGNGRWVECTRVACLGHQNPARRLP